MKAEQFIKYVIKVTKDKKLSVWHSALMLAILQLAYNQQQTKGIIVSRRNIMELSHINTIPTYHKYLRELQVLGYIHYFPSYHPNAKSTVDILNI